MKNKLGKSFLAVIAFIIIAPMIILLIWSVAENWRFPELLPERLSSRGIRSIFRLNSDTVPIVLSSIGISCVVALFITLVSIVTARAINYYKFPLKNLILFLNLLPLMVPATAFVMGVQIIFIKIRINDTVAGVILIHMICALPYSMNILADITRIQIRQLEEQAWQFGAGPLKAFLQISLPDMIPGIITSFSMSFIISFSQYFITLIIGGGNVQTLTTLMIPYIQSGDRTISCSYGVIFILTSLFVLYLIEKFGKLIKIVNTG